MLKKQMENRIIELEQQNHELLQDSIKLQENNSTLQLYVNQLRGKLQEVSNNLMVYESSMLVMATRLKEIGDLISMQNVENNTRSE